MCTFVLLRRPGHPWPVVAAANRDEMAGRAWDAPARHWPDRPDVIAGRDRTAGGSWMGINDTGVMAAILNRMGTLGPSPGKRSRGELVLDALDHPDAALAAEALADLDGRAWRPFNMVVADNRDAFWLRSAGEGRVEVHAIPPGLHLLTALELDDPASPRIKAYAPRFAAAPAPLPDTDEWTGWTSLLADTGTGADGEETPAMTFTRPDGFGTVSSSLLALPAPELERPPVWLFAAGRPDRAPFVAVGTSP